MNPQTSAIGKGVVVTCMGSSCMISLLFYPIRSSSPEREVPERVTRRCL
jgi:hypothetical protein